MKKMHLLALAGTIVLITIPARAEFNAQVQDRCQQLYGVINRSII